MREPNVEDQREPTWRRVVSRSVMLVAGLLLLWGGWACFTSGLVAAIDLQEEYRPLDNTGYRDGPSDHWVVVLPFWLGAAACWFPGILFTLFAVAPASLHDKLGKAILRFR